MPSTGRDAVVKPVQIGEPRGGVYSLALPTVHIFPHEGYREREVH